MRKEEEPTHFSVGLLFCVLPLILLVLQLSDEIVQKALAVFCRLLPEHLLDQLSVT